MSRRASSIDVAHDDVDRTDDGDDVCDEAAFDQLRACMARSSDGERASPHGRSSLRHYVDPFSRASSTATYASPAGTVKPCE